MKHHGLQVDCEYMKPRSQRIPVGVELDDILRRAPWSGWCCVREGGFAGFVGRVVSLDMCPDCDRNQYEGIQAKRAADRRMAELGMGERTANTGPHRTAR